MIERKIKLTNIEENKRFKQFRQLLKWNQQEMADFLKTTQKTVSSIENGYQKLKPEWRKKLIKEKKMNGTWYDLGTGSPIVGVEEKRTTIHDIKDMKADIDALQNQINAINKNMETLIRMIGEMKGK